jgi:hypothetical protein
MPTSTNLVLRTVYLDEALDGAIANQAQRASMTKADVFRQWLSRGIRIARKGVQLRETLPKPTAPLILHTVYLDAGQDDVLRVRAFDRHVPKNDVLREYLHLGRSVSHD